MAPVSADSQGLSSLQSPGHSLLKNPTRQNKTKQKDATVLYSDDPKCHSMLQYIVMLIQCFGTLLENSPVLFL